MGADRFSARNGFFRVFINGEERDAIRADSWKAARSIARARHRVSCDII